MPDEAHEFGAFLRVHPGGGLVEEQEVRAGRQGAGDFKAPLRPVGQARRLFVHVGIEREAVDEALRLLADFLFLAPCAGQAEDGHPPLAFAADLTADHDVFQRGFVAEEPDVLEGPGHARPADPVRREALHAVALEQDVAFLGVVEAADDVEGRGLARAVGADEPGDGPRGDPHGQVVDRRDPAEAHGHVLHVEQQSVLSEGGHARFLREKKSKMASQVISRIPMMPSRR